MIKQFLYLFGLLKLLYYKAFYSVKGNKLTFDRRVFLHPSSRIEFEGSNGKITIMEGTKITRNVTLKVSGGSCQIGCKVLFQPNSYIEVGKDASLSIGDDAFFNQFFLLVCMHNIQICNHVAIGTNVSFYDHDHVVAPNSRQRWELAKCSPILVERDVWIGANSIILRGSVIRHNSVIAAGSIIKDIVPENKIFYVKRKIILKDIN